MSRRIGPLSARISTHAFPLGLVGAGLLGLMGWLWLAVPGAAQQATDQAGAADVATRQQAEQADQAQDEAQADEQAQDEAEAELQRRLEEAMRAYEERLKAEAEARAKDPAWQPSHQQVGVIRISKKDEPPGVQNYCLGPDGNLLVCYGQQQVRLELDPETGTWQIKRTAGPTEIRVISPEGKLLKTWKLDFQPEAICVHGETIFVGGDGRLAKLDSEGNVLAVADSPVLAEPPAAEMTEGQQPAAEEQTQQDSQTAGPQQTGQEAEQPAESRSVVDALLSALGLGSSPPPPREPPEEFFIRASQQQRLRTITGLAASDRDLFVACPMREGYGYGVWRMDHDFTNPKLIVENLRGCCGQMDIQSHDGNLWIPENARHRVTCYDREGNVLSQFGRRDRKAADGFGGCCEPKNLRFGPDGTIYAAESGPPVAIKRFTAEGEFLGVVGLPEFKTGCVRVTVEVAPDGRVYILSPNEGAIYVLAPKQEKQEETN